MREIVTVQLGPQASWAGAHFWNFQDDTLHPEVAADGSVLEDPNAVDPSVLYRSSGGQARGGREDGPRAQRTPRLVVCDRAEHFGSLGAQGRRVPTAGAAAPAGGALPPVDPLSWGASVDTIVMEAHEPSRFVRSLYDAADEEELDEWREGEEGPHDEERRDDDKEQDDDDDEPRVSAARRRGVRSGSSSAVTETSGRMQGLSVAGSGAAAPAAPAPVAAPAPASFDFETTVAHWPDFLQTQLHSRSVAPLRAHTHNFSDFDLWTDGEEVLKREDAAIETDSLALLDRIRRFLEECDAPQGLQLLADVDSSFGGLGLALLTRVRDEMTSAPCVVLGFGTTPMQEVDEDAAPSAHAIAALNDALALTAYGELRTLYVPMPGHCTDVELRYPPVVHVDESLRFHTSALPAAWLDVATLPFRSGGTDRGGLSRLLGGLQAAPRFNLACAVLGLPLPPPVLGPRDVAGRRAWGIPRWGAFAPSSFLCPLSPWALPPSQASAFSQSVAVLGFPDDPAAIVGVIPRLLPCASATNTSLFARAAPLALPLPFPQFFSPDLGTHGQLLPPAQNREPRAFVKRAEGDEVMSLPTTAAIQSTPALGPLVSRVSEAWAEQRRVVEQRFSGHWGTDELAELTEELHCLRENYKPKAGGYESDSDEDDV